MARFKHFKTGTLRAQLAYRARQSKAAKTGERRQTGDHITAPSQTTPPPPHPSEEFDLTRWEGKHCVTPARGTSKQSTI